MEKAETESRCYFLPLLEAGPFSGSQGWPWVDGSGREQC